MTTTGAKRVCNLNVRKTSILLLYILKAHTCNMNADTASQCVILQSKKEYRLKINAM